MRAWPTWLAGLLLALSGLHAGEGGGISEQQLKVAYLYNFTKFVTWPASAFPDERASFQVCVMGDDPFGGLLDTLAKKSVQGRAFAIRWLGAAGQVTGCHVLFMTPAGQVDWSPLWEMVRDQPVLTVGDMPGFVQAGGMINFIRIKDTLRFEVHQERVLQAGLKVSAAMLQVGMVVK